MTTEFYKFGVCHLTKTFFIKEVKKENFLNSPRVENVGFFDVFKVENKKDYDFKFKELEKLNYVFEDITFLK